jgi:oligoribonuclease NrnB/cAMP/cGMP phosphodiesterase (DHH superfamily)
MKIKLFTHTDLDGVGCAIVGKAAFSDIDIEYCDYGNVNEKVKEFILAQEYFNYNFIYITDISVNEDVAELIENTGVTEIFQLLDHHPTALNLTKYDWCKIEIEKDNEKTSGTRMFYDYLLDTSNDLQNSKYYKWDRCYNLECFVENVRKYDTWLWKTKYNDDDPKMWNDLLYIMGRDEFIESILYRIGSYSCFDFCDFDLKLLAYRQKDIDKYIERKNKDLIKKGFKPNNESPLYNVGFVFAENYISELGNKLAEMNTDLDFIIIIINGKTISYRGIKDSIDLGKDVASIFGGGGHPNAAGSQISEDLKLDMIHSAFGFEV